MMNNSTPALTTATRYLLTITALVAVVVLANWLWTLTTFGSAIYVGEHKLQTLFYYHLYRSPMLLAVGLTFWAFYKKNPFWLVGNILLDFPIYYFVYGAIWLLGAQLAEPELIETVPLMNEWIVFSLIVLSTITFIYHWVSSQTNFKYLSKGVKYLTIYIIVLSLTKLIINGFTLAISSPLIYIAGNKMPLLEQFQIMINALPHVLLPLLAVWIMITQRFQYFLIIVLAGVYYTFFSNIPLIEGMKISWGATDILAIAGTVSVISMLVFYLSAFIIFCVWLYRWKPKGDHPILR